MDKILTARVIVAIVVVQALLSATFIVTGSSFWTDEFGTADIARSESFYAWWNQFIEWHNSDIQMPLYHGLMYFWSKLFGYSEYALRMLNLPFFAISSVAILSTFRQIPRLALLLLTFSTLHPLIWYYLDEARPYIMAYTGSMLTLCALVRLYAETCGLRDIQPYSGWLLACGLLLLAGTSMLGTPWVVAAVAITVYLHACNFPVGIRLVRENWIAYSVLAASLLILAIFYLYTLLRGARAADAFQSNILTLLFSGYELLGVSGLGPGRLELRAEGTAALKDWIIVVAAGASILGVGFLVGLRQLYLRAGSRQFLIIGFVVAVPVALIATAGLVLSWRVLGRHFMPFLPIVMSITAIGAAHLLGEERRSRNLLGAILVLTIAVSGISMKMPRHAKDDYQTAAKIAKQAIGAGQTVWWAADNGGAHYYGLSLDGAAQPGEQCRAFGSSGSARAYYVAKQPAHCLDEIPDPDVVILAKPDTFDRRGVIEDRIVALHLERTNKLPAFSIWRAPDYKAPKH